MATFLHVQSGLAMAAIHALGSEEQKQKWLPLMAKCEKIGKAERAEERAE